MKSLKSLTAIGVGTGLTCLSLLGCGPGAGFLGLQDYGRDILFSIGGRLATVALLNAINPGGLGDNQGNADAPGTPGAPGPAVFSVQVDNFLTGQADANLGLVITPTDEPQLFEGSDPVAFTAAIPSNYDGTSALSMRLRFFRDGACDGSCLLLSIDARCIADGAGAPQCVGGTADDCSDGTRFVQVDPLCTEGDADDRFVVVDLPLGSNGLDFTVQPGDFLAFELNTTRGDGGVYSLLGAEIATGQVPLRSTILRSGDPVPASCE